MSLHEFASFDNLKFPPSLPCIPFHSNKDFFLQVSLHLLAIESPKCVAGSVVQQIFQANVGKKVGTSACEVKRHHLESKEWSSWSRMGD